MPMPPTYPPEPSLDATGGRATFDGHIVRLERWGREADRRRCAYAAAPIGSVRGVQVMTTPDAAFLAIDVVAPSGRPTGIPTRPGALARSVWTLRVPDPAKAARFADMVARHAPKEAVPLERAPRTDRKPVLLIAVAASLAVLGGWTVYEAQQPEPVKTRIVKRTVVKEKVRTVTSCPTQAPPTTQEQAPTQTPSAQPETDTTTQSQSSRSDGGQGQSQPTGTNAQTQQGDAGTHADGQNTTQESDTNVQ